MLTRRCDRCGSEIDVNKGDTYKVILQDYYAGRVYDRNVKWELQYDLCKECTDLFREFIGNNGV